MSVWTPAARSARVNSSAFQKKSLPETVRG
jgi:hypothetical protein